MKVSEAIRLGSMLGPQARGSLKETRRKYFFGLIGPRVEATCALGSALAAGSPSGRTTKISDGNVVVMVPRGGVYRVPAGQHYVDGGEWRVLGDEIACPACPDHPTDAMLRIIPHLNDEHRWTREQIAAFVETIERRIEIESTEREAAHVTA